MGSLRVNKLVYSGLKYSFESSYFENNIVLIEGYNGTGKSTFCNLIYFAMGGEVSIFRKNSNEAHKEITSDTDNCVDLYISIQDDNYVLKRFIGDNDITVVPYNLVQDKKSGSEKIVLENSGADVFAVNRQGDKKVFSDWMLKKLGITVVDLFYGYKNFKINFSDLQRLIYHDQEPDPKSIYKRMDTNSTMVTDSSVTKKAIFELLIGKSYSKYYDAISDEKRLQKDKDLAKSLVDEYKSIVDKLRPNGEFRNISFLQADVKKKENDIDKLQEARNSFKSNRKFSNQSLPESENIKSSLVEAELKASDLREELINLLDERYKLEKLKNDTSTEIENLKKVLFSHSQLNLFSSDSCPYCLSKVDRAEGHCVCGASIEEAQFERFFYSTSEYKSILKTKIKSMETIFIAYDDCNSSVQSIQSELEEYEKLTVSLREQLRSTLARSNSDIDVDSLNTIDDKILELREDLTHLYQLIEMESKVNSLDGKYEGAVNALKMAKLTRAKLESEAKLDIQGKVADFSKKYNELITSTLKGVQKAKITLEDYMPVINEGEYKEASSKVAVRLMYFLTLLHLSLADDTVSFPRFLLIDTPETAGIEPESLRRCLSKFMELFEYKKDFQVILATGLGKYPDSMADYRVLYMPTVEKHNMLLKEKA